MARRRMVDPVFWDDRKVGKLSRDERSFILGCIGHADDEGRLQGDPAYLKSQIFKYDKDLDENAVQQLRDSCLEKMKSWPANHPYLFVLYTNSDEEYIAFPNFAATNKPSHAVKSQLPAPPPETLPLFSGKQPETPPIPASESPEDSASHSIAGQVRSGQSSVGKVSVGKVREVQEDFAKIHDEKDLTDRLTDTLNLCLGQPAPHLRMAAVLKQCWEQRANEKMPENVFQLTADAVRRVPIPILAQAYAKAVDYAPGKKNPASYLKKILEEKARSP